MYMEGPQVGNKGLRSVIQQSQTSLSKTRKILKKIYQRAAPSHGGSHVVTQKTFLKVRTSFFGEILNNRKCGGRKVEFFFFFSYLKLVD